MTGVAQMMKFVFETLENIVGKGINMVTSIFLFSNNFFHGLFPSGVGGVLKTQDYLDRISFTFRPSTNLEHIVVVDTKTMDRKCGLLRFGGEKCIGKHIGSLKSYLYTSLSIANNSGIFLLLIKLH